MEDAEYLVAFELITHAGNARSCYMDAVKSAKAYDFKVANEKIKEGDIEFKNAHDCQNSMIVKEANGEKTDVNIILVHAQDHLTMATIAKDNAYEAIDIYQKFEQMEKLLDKQK